MNPQNRLGQEKSPYLKQHKDNPVNWYSWGEEAFRAAREQDKPIFLSIGYSTCYWCHVMEKDSFEQNDVAAVLNRDFISIKVDREEHPDVDEIYMDALIGMTGRGGWPMSMFLTTELKPFWGGTFFPRPNFIQILERLAQLWKENRSQINENGNKLVEYLSERREAGTAVELPVADWCARAIGQFRERFDAKNGGFGGAPKFPPTMALRFLLRQNTRNEVPEIRHMILNTLDAMATGGIYDQVGGGFHRYSVDAEWIVPHFEKMLYDNALLVNVYAEAYQAFGIPHYSDIVRETCDYVLREMRSPDGAFYAAQDAGDVGKEGEFYVWTYDQLKSALTSDEFSRFSSVFSVNPQGNFENGHIVLHVSHIREWIKRRELKPILQKLFSLRAQRRSPNRDDKILTAWNGLMIGALAKAGRVLGEESYTQAALEAARFLRKHLQGQGKLLRRYCEGEAKYLGTLADYSYLVSGLIDLYQSSLQEEWLQWACELQNTQDESFWDEEKGGYWTADRAESNLVVRKKDMADGALPAGNNVAAENIARLYHYSFDPKLKAKLETLGQILRADLEKIPMAYAQFLLALDFARAPVEEIVLTGRSEDSKRAWEALFRSYLPYAVWGAPTAKLPLFQGKENSEFKAYVCTEGSCQKPIDSLKAWQDFLATKSAEDSE